MITVPHALLTVQGIHLDSGSPVSRPCYFRLAVCSWVVVAQTVRHSLLQSSSVLGVASSIEDVATVAVVEESVPRTCPYEAASVASVVSAVPTTWLGQPANFDHLQIFASVHLLETGDVASAVSVPLMILSAC